MRWLSALWQRPRLRTDMSLKSLRGRGFLAIDLETTGLDRRHDRIVSLAVVKFLDSESVTMLVTLVNPGQRIPASSTRIHGIDDAMVEDAPDEASAVRRMDELCAGQVIAGHGVEFDIAVMARARRDVVAAPKALAALCTQRLAAALHPAWSDFSLEGVCLRLGVPIERRHTADGDAVMAGRLLVRLLPRLEQRGIHTLAEALWFQDRGPVTG